MTQLPRYTVELTTEGWQIKKPDGSFFVDVFASKEAAEVECGHVNRIDWAEGQGRR